MNRRVYYKRGYDRLYVFVLGNGLQYNGIISFGNTPQEKLQAEIAYLDLLVAGH